MSRPKITELGRLKLLDDGGLVCLVTTNQPPSLDASAREASRCWASANQGEPMIGDLVVHSDHGVARYRGHKSINQGDCEEDFLLLEFAAGSQLYVPLNRSDLLQKLDGEYELSNLESEKGQWPQSYCVEALPNAYEWPGIGTFPKPALPQESEWRRFGANYRDGSRAHEAYLEARRKVMTEWRCSCMAYQKALHANVSYRLAAQEYFERQSREPQPLLDWWVYRAIVLRVGPIESANDRDRDERLLLIKQYVLRRERQIEKIRREVETLENYGSLEGTAREPIPEHVRLFVWRRDKGQCVRCGSRERLEFDHIIPVVAGGGNTERNIQLLCESCNRSKSATV
jgi:5-methylcytosine-specific restriction endonuclease McrA